MKNMLFSVLAIITILFISCQKNSPVEKSNNLAFIHTTPGGCAVDTGNHNYRYNEPDTAYWTINNDSLTFFVGFNDACCLNFKTESHISNDSIFMNIIFIPGPVCSCVCYYTYEFLFTGIDHPYYYDINLFDYKHYTGVVKP